MAAMSMLTKEVLRKNMNFTPGKPTEYRNYLVISIGTGSPRQAEKRVVGGHRDQREHGTLIGIGKELLKSPVSMVNIDTGMFEPVTGEGTNEDALGHFA
ncbi:hypothetical protein PR202_gb13376 [Eleusine coracana subsp. coracana]|uniref:Uncharacterized protein n=1 Tax=Eleusine coracana subsp. coracana TaxID=191504 RepID=A0AAV5ESA0_ELECO|nr:hypothetical protein PR202_gb13376 [Eleusine coracana subsp. coracana]